LSKIENGHLVFGDAPDEGVILNVVAALGADADESLLLTHKIPEPIRKRVLERPDAFRRLAALDDAALDRVLTELECRPTAGVGAGRPKRT
jgi:hypothetical protein